MAFSGGSSGSRLQSPSGSLFFIPESRLRLVLSILDASPSSVRRSHRRPPPPPGLQSPLRYRGCAFGPSHRRFRRSGSRAVEESETTKMAPGVGDADEGEFDHSQNDELRMCGLAGDEEEDDVPEDCAKLFGRSAADPLPCDQDAVPVHGEGPDPDADGGDSEVAGSNRPSTSAVWDDFEKHFKKLFGRSAPIFAVLCSLLFFAGIV
ncbi:unnamed protein product [Miscanthus lutarioriparius]|uniref:Uncharacterized protein n=1 Tax=Miscanthus lutarioriparius TaxID=422564 RepID=A0A811PKC3_9POAL|nr:unnamed protein product [Miscanthus lutarioriparius]